jgi:HipA-like protein
MRKAFVLYKKEPAGELFQQDDGNFVFKYLDNWFKNERRPSISLTLPK